MQNVAKMTRAQRFGYARVSSDAQEMNLQLDALAKAGCDRIFSEKASSARASRPQLEECFRALRHGDTLVVWRLDRVGRSVSELISIVNDLSADGIGFESLTENIDTSNAAGELTFHVFAALAQFERNIIRERTRAGLQAARARGRKGGRRPKITAKDRAEMVAIYEAQTMTVADICKRWGIARSTFYRRVLGREYGEMK